MLSIMLNTREPVMSRSRQSACTHGACCFMEEADSS